MIHYKFSIAGDFEQRVLIWGKQIEAIVFKCSAADERLFWSFRHQSVISYVMISSRAVFWTQPVGMVN